MSGASGRQLLQTLDSTRLTPVERPALANHAAKLNGALVRFQRVDTFGRYYYAGLGLVVLLAGAAFLYTLRPSRGSPLTSVEPTDRGADRLDGKHPAHGTAAARPSAARRPRVRGAATGAARDGTAIEQGRAREIEAERLRAFRETARRVAHEMRNPLTPIRLAVAQLARSSAANQQDAIEVLVAESDRLEQLAREFTEFGRLPEGPAAPIDLAELLTDLAHSSVPPTMQVRLAIDDGLPSLLGHYDPLRRAFGNVLRNAVEASNAEGVVEVAGRLEDGAVRIEVRDHGTGVPPDLVDHIFDPYVTGKSGGTGLGLALARQTVEMHHGTIAVEPTPGGGATFVVRIRGR